MRSSRGFQVPGLVGRGARRVRRFRSDGVHADAAGQGQAGGGAQGLPGAHLRKRHRHSRTGNKNMSCDWL